MPQFLEKKKHNPWWTDNTLLLREKERGTKDEVISGWINQFTVTVTPVGPNFKQNMNICTVIQTQTGKWKRNAALNIWYCTIKKNCLVVISWYFVDILFFISSLCSWSTISSHMVHTHTHWQTHVVCICYWTCACMHFTTRICCMVP